MKPNLPPERRQALQAATSALRLHMLGDDQAVMQLLASSQADLGWFVLDLIALASAIAKASGFADRPDFDAALQRIARDMS
jgi:phage protein U